MSVVCVPVWTCVYKNVGTQMLPGASMYMPMCGGQ